MMKRLVALFLALTMALALYVPVQAAEDPAVYRAFGYESIADLVSKTSLQRSEYDEAIKAIKKLDAEEFYNLELGLLNDINKDSYCSFWGLSEQEFEEQMKAMAFANYCAANDWVELSVWTESQKTAWEKLLRERRLLSYGGVPGQINILLNDHCITFPDAVPEGRNGRTMVPLRAAMESMGALVDYDPVTKSAVVSSEKISFTHVIGTKDIVLSDGSVKTMDVTSYAENGRTMVPLRFFSEVLGYDVQWDNDYRMAYLLDRETMITALDSNHKKLNSWLAAYEAARVADLSRTYESKGTFRADYTFYDEIGRGYRGKLKLLFSEMASIHGVSMEISGDLRSLAELLPLLSKEAREKCEKLFDDIDVKFIVSAEDGYAYLGGKTVTKLTSQTDNTYLRMPAFMVMVEQGESSTVGEQTYELLLASAETNYFQRTYSSVWETAETLLYLFRDELSTEGGGTRKIGDWSLDESSIPRALGRRSREYAPEDYDQLWALTGMSNLYFSVVLGADGSLGIQAMFDAMSNGQQISGVFLDYGEDALDYFLSVNAYSDGERLLELILSTDVTSSEGAAEFAPPEGANIVDADSIEQTP